MDKTKLIKRVWEERAPGHCEERKAEKIMKYGVERGYEEERLVHQ